MHDVVLELSSAKKALDNERKLLLGVSLFVFL